jgi:proteasome accessory factor C
VTEADGGVVFETEYADSRQLVSWVLGLGRRARILEPPELVEEAAERVRLIVERHASPPELAPAASRSSRSPEDEDGDARSESPIRPERFARLVTLAGILIEAAREARKLEVAELCESLQVSPAELRQDVDVLNVVNFGGGSYVLYAEVQGDVIEVDPEPYGDNFARPARLLPLEAKALVAAIDLIGEHLPEGSLASAREKIVAALGEDPATAGLRITTARGDDSEVARVVSRAIAERRLLEISPGRARWAREDRRVVEELSDGAVTVELPFAGHEYLAREILKEAGDAVVLEPDDARQAVLDAAEELAGAATR